MKTESNSEVGSGEPLGAACCYAERDLEKLGFEFEKHMLAMTDENLHRKGAIAAELAFRDSRIFQLEEIVRQLTSNTDPDLAERTRKRTTAYFLA